MKIIVLATALMTFSLSSNVNAALVDFGNYTRDTRTNLEWLDLTETGNLSYRYVSSQLGSGGEFGGWSFAAGDQVASFFDSAGGRAGSYKGPSNCNCEDTTLAILNYWGVLLSDQQM